MILLRANLGKQELKIKEDPLQDKELKIEEQAPQNK
jgi:hypothetical protein